MCAPFPDLATDYGELIYTVAATFKSRQAQSEDGGYRFVENALNAKPPSALDSADGVKTSG